MITRRSALRIATRCSVAVAAAALAGCESAPPSAAEPVSARAALDRALGAWKEGRTAESLKGDKPPIVVADHLWNQGLPLLNYEIDKNDHPNGANQRFQVVLWFKDEKGKEKKEKTEYDVGTAPVITVVRPF